VDASLFATIAAIAAADALNPAPTIATAYLLSTPRPLKRVLTFLASAIITRVGVGAVLLLVFGRHIDRVIEALRSGKTRTSLQIAVSFLLVGGALYWWRKPRGATKGPEDKKSSPATAARAFRYGVTLTLIECLTAIPYIGGLGSIERGRVSPVAQLVLVGLFNVIYHAPPLALVLLWRRSGQRSVDAIERARATVSRVFADRRWALVLLALGVGIFGWTVVMPTDRSSSSPVRGSLANLECGSECSG
jgi:cytochrome c biogenesis protein CcdA